MPVFECPFAYTHGGMGVFAIFDNSDFIFVDLCLFVAKHKIGLGSFCLEPKSLLPLLDLMLSKLGFGIQKIHTPTMKKF